MLTVHHLSKSYGLDTVLSDITFSLSAGERLGLVGPNGCGKTTLLRILSGAEKPDTGRVQFTASGLRIGMLPQGFPPQVGDTIASFLRAGEATVSALAVEVERLAGAFSQAPGDFRLQTAYDAALKRLEAAVEQEANLPEVLGALGLAHFDPQTPLHILSGGQKTRLALARILLSSPQLLLLDEPTNHLDLQSQEVLQELLSEFAGTILLVSHDRYLVDRLATHLWVIEDRQLVIHEGGYSQYVEQRAKSMERAKTVSVEKSVDTKAKRQVEKRAQNLQRNGQRAKEKQVAEMETNIAALEARLQELSRELEAAGVSGAVARVHELGSEYAEIEQRLHERIAEWSEAAG